MLLSVFDAMASLNTYTNKNHSESTISVFISAPAPVPKYHFPYKNQVQAYFRWIIVFKGTFIITNNPLSTTLSPLRMKEMLSIRKR